MKHVGEETKTRTLAKIIEAGPAGLGYQEIQVAVGICLRMVEAVCPMLKKSGLVFFAGRGKAANILRGFATQEWADDYAERLRVEREEHRRTRKRDYHASRQAAKPAKPTKPAKPAKPASPAKPAKPAKPVKPAKPAKPAKQGRPGKELVHKPVGTTTKQPDKPTGEVIVPPHVKLQVIKSNVPNRFAPGPDAEMTFSKLRPGQYLEEP